MSELRSELILNANGVTLCAETFGERRDPAVLLIMGSAASMDWWDEELCEPDRRRRTIRRSATTTATRVGR